jgi:hypothetical protein
MFWRGLPCRIIRRVADGWFKILVLTPASYSVLVRDSELN